MPATWCARGAAIALALAMSLVIGSIGAAQGKDTMWTTVSASGTRVSLTWHKDHPWDAELRRGGAQLIARYPTDQGVASEAMSTASPPDGNSRLVGFTLREDLRSAPQGQICLFIQLPTRKSLPVRKADERDSDTVGFRYEAWERQVRAKTYVRLAQERVAQAERALTVASRNLAEQESVVARRGWDGPEACSNIAVRNASTPVQPYDAVPPASHDDVARRVCVRRVWNARGATEQYVTKTLRARLAKAAEGPSRPADGRLLKGTYTDAFMLPELVETLLDGLLKTPGSVYGTLKGRIVQAAEFRMDWQRLSPGIGEYEPHVGRAGEILKLPSTADAIGLRVLGPALARQLNAEWAVQALPPATERDKEGLLGVALDAYFGCLEDLRKQLKIKWSNWQALAASAPSRATATRDFFVRECQQELALRDQLRATHTEMQQQLTRERHTLEKVTTQNLPLPARPQVLNASACARP